MSIDVTPTKEIKGITIRSIIQFVAIIVTLIWSYSSLTYAMQEQTRAAKELKESLDKNQQYNEFQFRAVQNQLREQEVRLTRLETIVNDRK